MITLRNFLHGFVLLLAFYFAFVTALYGQAWVSEKWSQVQIGPGVLGLWALSVVLWLLFSIAGNARIVPAEDEGRVTRGRHRRNAA